MSYLNWRAHARAIVAQRSRSDETIAELIANELAHAYRVGFAAGEIAADDKWKSEVGKIRQEMIAAGDLIEVRKGDGT